MGGGGDGGDGPALIKIVASESESTLMSHHDYNPHFPSCATPMDSYPSFPRYKVLIGALFKSQQLQSGDGVQLLQEGNV